MALQLSELASRFRGTRTITLLLLGVVVCVVLFAWRNNTIGERPLLDGRVFGYTADEASALLDRLSPGDRQLYAITALTLDIVFPAIYVALLLGWTARLFPNANAFLALPVLTGIADVCENIAVAYLALSHPNGHPLIATIAGGLTLTKWWTTVVTAVVLTWGTFRLRTRTTTPSDSAWVRKIEDVLEHELTYVRRRRRHSEAAHEDPRATLVGVALSGGGIRSATTCLGMLQALSRLRILPLADYISTVSGGGYIGGCLTSLLTLTRDRGRRPYFSTEWETFPLNPEHREGRAQVDHLRTHGSFLVTRTGLLARETMRSIGYLLSGTLYHLAMALLALTIVALFYLAGVFRLSPGLHETLMQEGAPRYLQNDPAYIASEPARSERNIYRHPTLLERVSDKYAFLRDAAQNATTTEFGLRAIRGAVVFGDILACVAFLYLISAYRRHGQPQAGESERDARERALLRRLGIAGFYATVLVFAVGWVNRGDFAEVLWLFLPALSFLTALATSFVLHLFLPRLGRFEAWNRTMRSLWGAFQAMTWYAFLIALVLALFPLATYASRDASGGVGLSGAAFLAFARLLTSRTESTAGRWSVPASVRRFLLGGAVAIGVLLVVVAITASIVPDGPSAAGIPVRFLRAALIGVAAFVGLGWAVDANRVSPHYFYQDRLGETYLFTERREREGEEHPGALATARNNCRLPLKDLHGPLAAPEDPTRTGTSPYHLVSTAINLASSRDLTRKDRKSGYFLFSKLFCGSVHTGFLATSTYRGGDTTLARAMTISGAAASSGIGVKTFFAQSLATCLFNLRLGYWMPNPNHGRSRQKGDRLYFWPRWLAREMFMRTSERGVLVNLSDGGHTGDNVGIYPLLQRRCRVIIACDAERDSDLTFGSITEALRHAQIDLGIDVDIDFTMVRADPATGMSRRHCAVGLIRYPPPGRFGRQEDLAEMKDQPPSSEALVGYLIYLKNSLTGDEPEPVLNYKSDHREFPHETTVDQFFDDAQFESYRALGVHIVESSLGQWAADPMFEAFRERYWPFPVVAEQVSEALDEFQWPVRRRGEGV